MHVGHLKSVCEQKCEMWLATNPWGWAGGSHLSLFFILASYKRFLPFSLILSFPFLPPSLTQTNSA